MNDRLSRALEDFEHAWHELRSVVQRAERGDAAEAELVEVVNVMVATRLGARGVAMDRSSPYGDPYQGDQVLAVCERRVGANSRALDQFVQEWSAGAAARISGAQLLERVRALLVDPIP